MVVQDDATSGWCSGAPALYRFSANQRVVAIIKWNVFVLVVASVALLLGSWASLSCHLFFLIPFPCHTIPYQGAKISISRARAIGAQPQEITSMCTASPAAHNLVSVAMICASPDALHSGQGIAYHVFQQQSVFISVQTHLVRSTVALCDSVFARCSLLASVLFAYCGPVALFGQVYDAPEGRSILIMYEWDATELEIYNFCCAFSRSMM